MVPKRWTSFNVNVCPSFRYSLSKRGGTKRAAETEEISSTAERGNLEIPSRGGRGNSRAYVAKNNPPSNGSSKRSAADAGLLFLPLFLLLFIVLFLLLRPLQLL